MLMDRPVIFLPFLGEFGVLVFRHVPFIHSFPASRKIVCCERGQEYLFPTAAGFFYDWVHPIPDANRAGESTSDIWLIAAAQDALDRLRAELRSRYPDAYIINPGEDGVHYAPDSARRPSVCLRARALLEVCDFAIAARRRQLAPARNYAFWPQVVAGLHAAGRRVSVVGEESTSFSDCGWDVRAWDHPDGATAGTIDCLQTGRVFIGTDTGVTHLAAAMSVPMVVFRKNDGSSDGSTKVRRSSNGIVVILGVDAWENPDVVVQRSIRLHRQIVSPYHSMV